MGLKDIVNELQKTFDTKKGKVAKKIAAIEFLVAELVAKEASSREKLALADNDRDRSKYERRIKVCKAQITKGAAALEDLRDRPQK